MKIAQVSLRFDAPGGVETTVRELSHRLHSLGEDVTVYSSDLYDEGRWERRTDFRPEVDGVPVRRFPVRKRLVPGLTMPMMVGLVRALDQSGSEVLHAHSHRYGHVLETAAVAERRGIPLVISTHYHPADRGEPTWKRGMLRLQDVGFGATAYRVARALVVESEFEARLVREFAPAERIRVIPPGIDLTEWTRAEPDALPPGLPPEYFLFSGRMAPNKGLLPLIDALALLPSPQRRPLVIMGPDWGMRAAVEARARERQVVDSVVFLGAVDQREVRRAVMRHASVFVLPSEWEAFGLVLLEAMAAGTPIVATSVGGVPEVLDRGKAGLLVPFGDPPALARAIGDAVDSSSATQQRTRAATERVRTYDWSVAAERHRALYRELVGA